MATFAYIAVSLLSVGLLAYGGRANNTMALLLAVAGALFSGFVLLPEMIVELIPVVRWEGVVAVVSSLMVWGLGWTLASVDPPNIQAWLGRMAEKEIARKALVTEVEVDLAMSDARVDMLDKARPQGQVSREWEGW